MAVDAPDDDVEQLAAEVEAQGARISGLLEALEVRDARIDDLLDTISIDETRLNELVDRLVRTDARVSELLHVIDLRDAQILELALEVEGLVTSQESRGVIEQAKGVIMTTMRCTPDAAFAVLVAQSTSQNRKLKDIAAELTRLQDRPLAPE